ncbi:cell division protein SepF [Ornithinimicrobium faecis]|uniref:Cell division protein SepF n=1 Tax=Ornithinimicrobium faecis TaxID=2934158 RepID=A0ABY4YXN0_9MICO|nr:MULTISPECIES: cell division protein SepF [unclassified Ornithinimicrobium]USQ81536.1 cell division protein SepF [Ornithinimicrobium sp. HY1793]
MAGALRKTMEYLGLAETDERYDDYDYDEPERAPERETRPAAAEPERPRGAEVTQLPTRHNQEQQRTPVARVVREAEVEPMNRITTIHPRTYNEAKNIGEAFRGGVPVIMNLSDMDDADAKRLVDFAAGLAFGLHGSIERVTSKVFLLSPQHVEVDGPEADAPKQALFNQS